MRVHSSHPDTVIFRCNTLPSYIKGRRTENDLTNMKGQAGAVVLILIWHVDESGLTFHCRLL